jgi:hypothetical protein
MDTKGSSFPNLGSLKLEPKERSHSGSYHDNTSRNIEAHITEMNWFVWSQLIYPKDSVKPLGYFLRMVLCQLHHNADSVLLGMDERFEP